MKSRSNELLDRAKSAMVAAVEIYNKPGFPYRAESFAILAVNGWELLLKAKWLSINHNKKNSLYVYETRNKDGNRSRKRYIKRNRSGTPFTLGLDYLIKQLVIRNHLDTKVSSNLTAMLEVRDSATHFYNPSKQLQVRLYQFSAACVKNFATLCHEWFGEHLTEFDLQLMPLTFIDLPSTAQGLVLNSEEKNFLSYLDGFEASDSQLESPYSISINVEVRFVRSKSTDALPIRITDDPLATEIQLTEEQIRERYPLTYADLTEQCKKRYKDFKVNPLYHKVRKGLESNSRHAMVRLLDPQNPDGQKKPFFNPAILSELDKHFTRKD